MVQNIELFSSSYEYSIGRNNNLKEMFVRGDVDISGNIQITGNINCNEINSTSIKAATFYGDGSQLTGIITSGNSYNLNDLDNVNITGLENNEILKYNSTSGKWENSNRIDTLDELGDVTLTGVTTSDLLRYNGTNFVNTKIAFDNDFTNVNFTSLTNGDLIKYNGTNFINFAPTYLDSAGINDNFLIKVVGGVTTQTTFRETSALNSTSLQTYIPLGSGFSIAGGSIETEIFDTIKQRMHLTTGGIENANGITITSDGKVGIGVVNPEEDLELDGNIQLHTGGAERGRVIFYDKQNDHEHAEVHGLGEGTNGGVLAFYTKEDGGSVTEKMRIRDDGNVGIGTTNPNRKLKVNGDIEGEDLYGQTFGPTYTTLPSLTGKVGQIVFAANTAATLVVNNNVPVRTLTIPYTGVWAIDMDLFLGNAYPLTGDIRYVVRILINGVQTQRFHGTQLTGVYGSCKRNLSVNDVVSFDANLTGSGSTNMTATQRNVWGTPNTFLSATRIA